MEEGVAEQPSCSVSDNSADGSVIEVSNYTVDTVLCAEIGKECAVYMF